MFHTYTLHYLSVFIKYYQTYHTQHSQYNNIVTLNPFKSVFAMTEYVYSEGNVLRMLVFCDKIEG